MGFKGLLAPKFFSYLSSFSLKGNDDAVERKMHFPCAKQELTVREKERERENAKKVWVCKYDLRDGASKVVIICSLFLQRHKNILLINTLLTERKETFKNNEC